MAVNNTRLIIAVLVITVIILASIIGVSYYQGYAAQKQQVIYTAGYQRAIFEVMNASSNCQVVPLILGNQTVKLADITCLQQALQQELQKTSGNNT